MASWVDDDKGVSAAAEAEAQAKDDAETKSREVAEAAAQTLANQARAKAEEDAAIEAAAAAAAAAAAEAIAAKAREDAAKAEADAAAEKAKAGETKTKELDTAAVANAGGAQHVVGLTADGQICYRKGFADGAHEAWTSIWHAMGTPAAVQVTSNGEIWAISTTNAVAYRSAEEGANWVTCLGLGGKQNVIQISCV